VLRRKAWNEKVKERIGKMQWYVQHATKLREYRFKVVQDFDRMDGGDPSVPPQFSCEACGGGMYPEYYIGVHGYEYKITDIRKT